MSNNAGKILFKTTIGFVIILIALIAGAVAFLLHVDPNQYKADIQKAISDATGAQLELKAIEWDLWPHFQLQLQGLQLSTDAQENNQLLAVDSASLKVALIPLLTSTLIIDHFTLTKPSIWFDQDKDGNHNWQPLLDTLQSTAAEPAPPPSETKSNFQFEVKRLEITEGMLNVSGAQAVLVQPIHLDIQNIQFDQPMKLTLSSVVQQLDQQLSIQLESNIKVDQAITALEFTNVSLSAQGTEPEQQATLEGSAGVVLNPMAITAALNVHTINLDAWMKAIPLQVEATTSTSETSKTHTSKRQNTEKTPTPLPIEALRELTLDASFQFENIIFKEASHTIAFAIKANNGLVTLNNFVANAYEGTAKGAIKLNTKPSPAAMTFDLDITDMAIASVLKTWTGTTPMSGELNSAIHVTTSGNTVEALIDDLKGATDLAMANAILPKLDLHALLWDNLEQKQSGLVKTLDSLPALKKELGTLKTPKIMRDSTELNQLLAQFKITPQAITSQNISATLNNKPITATLIYGRKSQDLTLNTQLQLPFKQQELADILWPLTCKGSLSGDYSCSLDAAAIKPALQSIAQQEAKSAIKEKLAPVKEKAKDTLEKELGRSLDKFFKRD